MIKHKAVTILSFAGGLISERQVTFSDIEETERQITSGLLDDDHKKIAVSVLCSLSKTN